MSLVAFDMNSAVRSRGTKIFAGATADATPLIDNRNFERHGIVRILSNHADRAGRAMSRTIVAADLVSVYNAQILVPYCMTDLNR